MYLVCDRMHLQKIYTKISFTTVTVPVSDFAKAEVSEQASRNLLSSRLVEIYRRDTETRNRDPEDCIYLTDCRECTLLARAYIGVYIYVKATFSVSDLEQEEGRRRSSRVPNSAPDLYHI
jgi:hypothetical protein